MAGEVRILLVPISKITVNPGRREALPGDVKELADSIAEVGLINPIMVDLLDMLHLAAHGVPGLRVCDIELSLPRPSYTINTLRALSAAYPSTDFRLVIGSDNMLIFDRWKCHEEIMRDYPPIVYPRPGYPCPGTIDLPQYDISSTIIRERLRKGESVDGMLPPQVINYISRHGLYR